jgi:hypothetical protein
MENKLQIDNRVSQSTIQQSKQTVSHAKSLAKPSLSFSMYTKKPRGAWKI